MLEVIALVLFLILIGVGTVTTLLQWFDVIEKQREIENNETISK